MPQESPIPFVRDNGLEGKNFMHVRESESPHETLF